MEPNVLREMYEKRAHDVECGEEFPISATFSLPVIRCNNYTEDEEDTMFTALIRDWEQKARAACSHHGDCPEPELVDMVESDNTCDDKLWTVIFTMTTKCTPL